ncbi:hypothetical protein E0G74_01005 [Salmonella enterica]|nr:hypothetical protein [Salmonella enterica]ECB1886241.1 hypothetical protein [Salmonella enterica subsp. enterica serovar Mississippi]
MTKKTAAKEAAGAPQEAKAFPISLTDYCKELSLTEKRYPLISAFFRIEEIAGRKEDTKAAYDKRYAEFLTSPAQ